MVKTCKRIVLKGPLVNYATTMRGKEIPSGVRTQKQTREPINVVRKTWKIIHVLPLLVVHMESEDVLIHHINPLPRPVIKDHERGRTGANDIGCAQCGSLLAKCVPAKHAFSVRNGHLSKRMGNETQRAQ
jgi:hypothetical protein